MLAFLIKKVYSWQFDKACFACRRSFNCKSQSAGSCCGTHLLIYRQHHTSPCKTTHV